jgi:hypothetical protein
MVASERETAGVRVGFVWSEVNNENRVSWTHRHFILDIDIGAQSADEPARMTGQLVLSMLAACACGAWILVTTQFGVRS